MLETYRFAEHFELFVFSGMSTPFYSFMFTHMHHHVGSTTVNPRCVREPLCPYVNIS